jgi:hypothetical protein
MDGERNGARGCSCRGWLLGSQLLDQLLLLLMLHLHRLHELQECGRCCVWSRGRKWLLLLLLLLLLRFWRGCYRGRLRSLGSTLWRHAFRWKKGKELESPILQTILNSM